MSSIAESAYSGGDTNTTGFAKENNWAYGAKTITHAGLGEGLGNAGMVAFSTVVGGGAAALTGGNFWVGAATGLVVSVCNHLAHQMEDGDPPVKKKGYYLNKEQLEQLRNPKPTEFGMGLMEYAEGGGIQLISKGISIAKESSLATKTIVIGEDMLNRVIPFAEKNGFKYFKPRGTNPANWMKNQTKWIYRQIKDPTVRIIDYGSKGINATSQYYMKELQMLKKYVGY